ncbi:receptor activity-modifying protein 1-like isoform 1-T1 [Salvelinus alpinus]|uniref:receptor activity-modifying protein 1-like isoform X1 n=2 Tax=Salvelinus TaxID=8033 RepID=UPI0039FCD308
MPCLAALQQTAAFTRLVSCYALQGSVLEVQAQSRWSSVSRGNSPMFTFSDMKGVLVFFAVLLSVLSDNLEKRGVSSGLGCGNKYVNCETYCDICVYFHTRTECYATLFKETCYRPFVGGMESLNNTDWCNWNNVKRMYNTFTMCTEEIAECLLIPWPNRMVENEFVNIHSRFFPDCPNEALSDPPPSIVFALVMTPICLIPIMVVLVVLKTKNGDGSS